MVRRTEAAAGQPAVVLLPEGAAMLELLAALPVATALRRTAAAKAALGDRLGFAATEAQADTLAARRTDRDAVLGAEILRLRRAVAAGQAALTRTGTELEALRSRLGPLPPPEAEARPDRPRRTAASRPRRGGARHPATADHDGSAPADAPPRAKPPPEASRTEARPSKAPLSNVPRTRAGQAPVIQDAADVPRPAAATGPTRRRPRAAGTRGDG